MNNLIVDSTAIRQYGHLSAAMATEVIAAAGVNQAATIAAAIPAFGLIGQDFLASFAVAQGNHLHSCAELATVHASTSVASHEGAATYDTTEECSAHDFSAISSLP